MKKCETCYHRRICNSLISKGLPYNDGKYPADKFCLDYESDDMTIRLPCRIGDTVYLITKGIIEPCEVEGIYFTRKKHYVRVRPRVQSYVGNQSIYYTPSFRSFGKTVFLLLENAERALQEINERKKGEK